MFKRLILVLLIFIMSFSPICNNITYSQQRNLTIDDITTIAKANSDGVQSVTIDKIKKQIELKQAQDGIRDIRKKESTVRFSLLLNIKFPEKHGMPKEIELIMKMPTIQNEIDVLIKQEPYELLKSVNDAKLAYYDVLLSLYNLDYLEKRIDEYNEILKKTTEKYNLGKAKKEDVDYIKNQLKTFETDKSNQITTLDNKKEKLSSVIGKDIKLGYTFEEYLPELSITRDMLPNIIAFSKKNDFELFQKVQARKLAEKEVEELLSIYKDKYAKYISDIESYIRSHEGRKIDYNEFISMYNHTLTNIDSPWYGNYVINLLFFKIYIPKEWFKGEYSGTRYMEDQKYALFVSLTERDKARKEEQNAIKQLEQNIKNQYNSIKQMEKAYSESSANLTTSQENYEKILFENMQALASFNSVETARIGLYEQQKSLYEMQIEYAKSLSSFDFATSGYITNLLSNTTSIDNTYQAGESFIDEATWYIKTTLTDYNFIFGVNIPSDYGVNYYELYYNDKIIGKRESIDNTIIHVPIAYNDSTLMKLKLYTDNKLSYMAYFDGSSQSGTLKLQEAKDAVSPLESTSNITLGTWNFEIIDKVRGEFSLKINSDYTYDSYNVVYKDNIIKTVKKDETIKTLKLYFSDTDKLQVNLFNGEKKLKTLFLKKGEDGNNILTDK